MPLCWFLRCSLIWCLPIWKQMWMVNYLLWYPSAGLLQNSVSLYPQLWISCCRYRWIQFPCQGSVCFFWYCTLSDTALLKTDMQFLVRTQCLTSIWFLLLHPNLWLGTYVLLIPVNFIWSNYCCLLIFWIPISASSAHLNVCICRTHTCPYLWMPSWGLLGSCLMLGITQF